MRLWATEVTAIDPLSGEWKTWPGEPIAAETRVEAQLECRAQGRGYQRVVGEIAGEVFVADPLYDMNPN